MGTFIRDKLWLGGVEDAYDFNKLKAQGTTHILTIECSSLREDKQAGFTCLFVDAEDSAEEDLLHHFDDCFRFIETARDDGNGGVLVHCFMGYSRSSTIVLSYLMRKEGLVLRDAMSDVMKLRNIGPNPGFMQQLRLFERMGNRILVSDPDYRTFALEKLTSKVREASFGRNKVTVFKDHPQVDGASMDRALALDPAVFTSPETHPSTHGATTSTQPRLLFRCRKCRRPLARSSSLLPHPPGRGKAFGCNSLVLNRSLDAIKCRGKFKGGRIGGGVSIADRDGNSEEACQEGLFFEPVEWMRDQILFLEGQLSCPKPQCGAKLGHFNWCGQPCPCGHWVVPAFHLAASKVDKCVLDARDPNAESETEPGGSSQSVGESSMDSPTEPGAAENGDADDAGDLDTSNGSPMKTAETANLASSDSPANVTSA